MGSQPSRPQRGMLNVESLRAFRTKRGPPQQSCRVLGTRRERCPSACIYDINLWIRLWKHYKQCKNDYLLSIWWRRCRDRVCAADLRWYSHRELIYRHRRTPSVCCDDRASVERRQRSRGTQNWAYGSNRLNYDRTSIPDFCENSWYCSTCCHRDGCHIYSIVLYTHTMYQYNLSTPVHRRRHTVHDN